MLPIFAAFAALIVGYLWHLEKILRTVPPEALALSPQRFTVDQVKAAAKSAKEDPIDVAAHLPPKRDAARRYIVVGGSGFLGGYIVRHLLLRGEDPNNIRIVDIRKPPRQDISSVPYQTANILDLPSLEAAFSATWPADVDQTSSITVFVTVANMRYYERHPSLLSLSTSVNRDGIQNILTVARSTPSVDIFIYTSSGSLPLKRTRFWIWPWERRIATQVQVVDDWHHSNAQDKRQYHQFANNYAYSKFLGESLVCKAHDPKNGFQTGVLRPGNPVYGFGGDQSVGSFLLRGKNPSWLHKFIHSHIYVENAAYAHILYEDCLLQQKANGAPASGDVGGESFLITDPGPPISYTDNFTVLETLTNGKTIFPPYPATFFLILATLIEQYHTLQTFSKGWLPPLGEIVALQPSMLNISTIHYKIDDSRARLPFGEGGIGYNGPWTSLQGLCQVVEDHGRALSLKVV